MEALGLDSSLYGNIKASRDFTKIAYHILKQHSGIGLKTFQLSMFDCNNVDSCHLDSWLHLALRLGIEELILETNSLTSKYNFPLSLLSAKGCLLPDSFALERLELSFCNKIICLKIPRVLLRLSYLEVVACNYLQVIESEAPNLSSFCIRWFHNHILISLGQALHVKKLEICSSRAFHYAQLPIIVPSLETLTIDSISKMISTPNAHNKFHQLKYLNIRVPGETHDPTYDYFSLASFLDASPCLETFILRVHVQEESPVEHGLFSRDPSHLRQMPEHGHEKLKRVQIGGFYPAKSLLELAHHVLESATSLECLALGTTYCSCEFGGKDLGKCYLSAIGTYIEEKVPSTSLLG
ncbi:unnamed protein product [Urochloa decumbens]|uniref:At1g61320/AtMIF1 LRR domain-containing protein n=1 Tax=Urochloa decumbens TaxID=240449 RepID=A0ABC9FV37_9POAL